MNLVFGSLEAINLKKFLKVSQDQDLNRLKRGNVNQETNT